MIRIKDLQLGLLGLVGWRQNHDVSDFKIAEELTKSESGLYFQDVHPLLTLDNLKSIAPDFSKARFPNYDKRVKYIKGSVVCENDQLYKAAQDSTGIGISDTEYWAETNPFSEWLEEKTKASITKAITRYITESAIKGTSKNILENRTLYDGTGRIVDTVPNKRNLVGMEIVPIRSKGVTTKINRICLQFTEPGDYTLYIMHSDAYEPIYTLTLTKEKANTAEWFKVDDIYLPYEGNSGGSWYVCYMQSGLPEGSHAIRKNRDWSKGPCSSCTRRDYEAWMLWSKYLEVHPFCVNEELIAEQDGTIQMWDIEDNIYTYDNNYGLNFDISVYCDITDFILSQRDLFKDVIAKQLAIDILREFAYNPNVRTNRHSINAARTDILYEIDGDSSSMKKSGLSYQLEQAIKAVMLDTKGIDRVCQPCVNNGVRYRTI